MPAIINDKVIEKKLKKYLKDSKDPEKIIKTYQLYQQVRANKEKKEQLQRAKVIRPAVDDEKLCELIGWNPYEPKRHDKQIEVLNSKAADIVICAGKRGGKTALCAYEALKALLEGKKVLVVAPSYGLCDRVLEYVNEWALKSFKNEIKVSFRAPQKVTTAWGAQLDCRSAEQPDQIMGTEYDVVIADECSKISEIVYQRYIRPATGTKILKHFYISTPFGRNWFWRAWRKAKKNGGAFQWASIENPYFSQEKWELEKKELPDLIFRQEYGAEFLEDTMVFQGFPNCLKNYKFPQDYNPNHLYLVGVDLGKYENFTAVEVIDRMTNQSVECLRFQGDWGLQKQKIMSVADKYGGAPIWMDSTSITVGDAYVQEMGDAGYNIMGYKLGGVSKRQLIEKLIVLIQNRNVSFPTDEIGTPDSIEFNTECKAFTYNYTPSGNILYQAPQGEYDDCVIARALACWELDEQPLAELKEGKGESLPLPEQTF